MAILILLLMMLVSADAVYSSGLKKNNFEPDVTDFKVFNEENSADKIIQKRSYDFGLWGLGGLGWPLPAHGWGHGLSLGHELSFGHGIWGGGLGGFGTAGLGWHGGWYPSLPLIHNGYGFSGWHHRR